MTENGEVRLLTVSYIASALGRTRCDRAPIVEPLAMRAVAAVG